MIQTTLASAIKNGLITNISGLRHNDNQYPFVTLFGPLGTTNLYFGKRSAEKVALASAEANFNMINFLAKEEATIILATNADKNQRFKLSVSGNLKEDVATKEDTLAAFGIDSKSVKEVEVPFDWSLFKAEFGTIAAQNVTAPIKKTSGLPDLEVPAEELEEA